MDLVEKQALKPAIGRHLTEEVESIFSTDEDLEKKERKPGPGYQSDRDVTDEKIAGGPMEITALSHTDAPKNEPAHE